MKDYLDEWAEEKATENSSVRWKDPEAWKCLSDEQRDTILQWYVGHEKRRNERIKEEQREAEAKKMYGLYFIGAAVGMIEAIHDGRLKEPFWIGLGWIAIEVISGIILCGVVAVFGETIGGGFAAMGESKWGRIWRGFLSVAIWTFLVGAIFSR